MINSYETERKNDAYKSRPFRKLVKQDAIIIIAIYAAQIDPSHSKEEINRIERIAESYPVCVDKKKYSFSNKSLC